MTLPRGKFCALYHLTDFIATDLGIYIFDSRSLEVLTNRVDELDAKINALNSKVSETCHNMADVIAYVDANMADMKDFLADVVKKLPNPKRLEVVGTLRKTLILHFECCHTGLEYPITSHEWSKWLKMGFSLVKAGQAVIELGIGNPLGILSKGVECVQEIYSAYKTNDDDEFNTYITQPFLTSTEQDQLLEKLRDQGFFEIFAYDNQMAGWFLLHPEKDGRKAEGESGSVTKVRTKEGYGVTEGLVEVAKGVASQLVGQEVVDTAVGAIELASIAKEAVGGSQGDGEEKQTAETAAVANPLSSGKAASGSNKPVVGNRAAAIREQLGPSATAAADNRLADANRQASYYTTVDQLEKKVEQLESKLKAMSTDLETLKSRQSSCACTIM